MAARGNKGKPTILKLVSGTARADRMLPNQPDARGEIGDAPGHFNELQRACWDEAKGTSADGLLTACDRPLFGAYALSNAALIAATKEFNRTGNAILLRSDQDDARLIVNPYLKDMRRSIEMIRQLANEFGFSPAARTRISLPTGESLDDPLAKFV